MKKQVTVLSVLIIVLLSILFLTPSILKKEQTVSPTVQPTTTSKIEANRKFSYEGREGVDALTLLKEKAEIKQDDSGLVTSVNGREADSGAREYWSFYVNGKMASVGPADYITKDTEKIEWKIETY